MGRSIELAAALLSALLLAGCAAGPAAGEGPPSLPGSAPAGEPAGTDEAPPQAAEDAEEPKAAAEPGDADFVLAADYVPGLFTDLKYAGTDNFTGQAIYEFTDAYLRYGTVVKLAVAQERLVEQGYSLLIWDAFRPAAAQFALWEVCPDPIYVANPETGFSSHSRGNTVDVALATAEGELVELPTGFDDFTRLADRDYSDIGPVPAANARLLEDVMTDCGFKPYSGEWWHFSDTEDYPVEEEFAPPAEGER